MDTRAHRHWASWFVGIAIGWTWGFGFLAVILGADASRPMHLVSLVGPLLAWIVVVAAMVPRGERATFLRRVFDLRRIRPRWWLAIIGVGAGPTLAAATAGLMAGAETAWAPDAAGLWLLGITGFALAAGLAEEPGWRGLAQDGVEPTAGRWRSALILGALWSLWHLPLYFIDGTYQHGLGVGTPEFWASMVARVPLAVLLVWLVAGTKGAIAAAVLAHALGNVVGELTTSDRIVMTLEVTILALAATAAIMHSHSKPATTRPPGP
jgi:uncharacterized protein